jgi:hypothetical protein
MMEKTIGLAGITAVVLLALGSAGTAQDSSSTAQQEERMGETVRTYLLKHPEIIDEAMQALRERQAAEAAAKTAQAQGSQGPAARRPDEPGRGRS